MGKLDIIWRNGTMTTVNASYGHIKVILASLKDNPNAIAYEVAS
jgi:hypothetical protein